MQSTYNSVKYASTNSNSNPNSSSNTSTKEVRSASNPVRSRLVSFGLLDPREVVGSRPNAGARGDEVLERRPEVELLERPVEPTGGDAEVCLVRRHVVHAVVRTRQDDVRLLQHLHPTRQPEVSVRPLRHNAERSIITKFTSITVYLVIYYILFCQVL